MSDCLVCVLKDIRNISHQESRRLEAAEALLKNLDDVIDFLSAFNDVEKEMQSIHNLVTGTYAGSHAQMLQRVEVRSARALAHIDELEQ